LARYYLGLPWYRLEGFQALVGIPVADATQWDLAEVVGDCSYPIFLQLEKEAAQGAVIFHDDTPHRILTLIKENQQARAHAQVQGKAKTEERTGRQTTAVIVQAGEQRICLYDTGRRHAGENLTALLTQREPDRGKPLVMSDALSSNNAAEDTLMRGQCLAHGRRKFSELDEAFPAESAVVVNALKDVFDHDEYAHAEQLTAQGRLA
jgi:transposase